MLVIGFAANPSHALTKESRTKTVSDFMILESYHTAGYRGSDIGSPHPLVTRPEERFRMLDNTVDHCCDQGMKRPFLPVRSTPKMF